MEEQNIEIVSEEFKKYQHVERFGTTETQGIELGECYIFPKIDGSNGCVWTKDGRLQCASRSRVLTLEKDNQGFMKWIYDNREPYINYLIENPKHRLFGEWLVKHSLGTYRESAWRKFYIFDVCLEREDGSFEYLPYEVYKGMLDKHNLNYIPPLAIVKNGDYETFIRYLDKNDYLIEDGKGVGEGIVIKNYGYTNCYHRQQWAKIVRSEFKEVHRKTMGADLVSGGKMIEEEIVSKFCTEALIEKEYAKIVTETNGWSSKLIPRLLNTVFYTIVKEDAWEIVKTFKQPTINFKTLNSLVINKIKVTKKELF